MKPSVKAFQKTVLDFYDSSGRNFPWRKTTNPYKVLVSEIMLQQTQVTRVEEKYPTFIAQFPTIEKLARARGKTVLRHWQGMGYNRRALHLHKTAKEIQRRYKGEVPRSMEELCALPGVGPATAGGVMAYAYNMPVAFIETNIRRVYIHHFFPKKRDVSDKDILPYVEETLDRENPRRWYWALMDYGSYLANVTENPNRRSRHYFRQSAFEGSRRQVRGEILRRSLSGTYDVTVIAKQLGKSRQEVRAAADQMQKEGFLK